MKKRTIDDLSPVEVRALRAELIKRRRRKSAVLDKYAPTAAELATANDLRNLWFPQQRKFFESAHRRKVGFCTRRAGKTIGSAIAILVTLLENPTSLVLYLAQTSQMARLYIWQELKRYVSKYNLPFEFNETNLFMTHTRGGGRLVCKGADKADEIEKLRGPKWKLAICDESASFGAFMESMVVEVIGPALRDEAGTLILIGTAGRKKEGLFWKATSGEIDIYEVHSWSLRDNPYLPEEAKDLEYIKKEEGLTDEDPRFIREYLGRWATGDSERVFSGFNSSRNVWAGGLPTGHDWKYLLGCDFGWNDETAISVVAYSPTHPTIFIPETWSKKHAYPSDIAAEIMRLRNKYGVRRYVGDTGGYGKAIVVQLAKDYQIMMQPAKKQEKLSFVEFMNSEFYAGKIQVHQDEKKLIGQFTDTAWNEDRTDVGKHERDDLAFSAVYGWRAARNSGAGKTAYAESEDDKLSPSQKQARRDKLETLRRKPNDDPKQAGEWYERYSARTENADRDGRGEWWELPSDRRRGGSVKQ